MGVIKGFLWKAVQQYSTYLLKLLFQIVLARILSPSEFGVLAEMLVFIALAEVFANGGLGTALVQKKDADEEDFSTSIVSGFVLSVVLYAAIFFIAPAIGEFYDEGELPMLLRVFGLMLPFSAFNSVQNARLLKSYDTKPMFVSSFTTTLISGVLAIMLAYLGYGTLALVIQSLLSMVLNVIVLQALMRWRPCFGFSITKFRVLFSFSWKVMLSGLLGSLLENIYNLFIGRNYGTEALGYYNRGNSFPSAAIGQLRSAISSVSLSFFSNSQDDCTSLLANVRKVTHLSVVVVFPLAFGLAAVAEPLVTLLLTEKWLPCVFFLRLECVFYGSLAISTSLGNAMLAVGRSDISLKIEGIKLALTLMCVSLCGILSVEYLCVLRAAVAVFMIMLSVAISRRVIGYGFAELAKDVWIPLILSAVMGAVCYASSFFVGSAWAKLLVQVPVAIAVYGVGVHLFMADEASAVKSLLRSLMQER